MRYCELLEAKSEGKSKLKLKTRALIKARVGKKGKEPYPNYRKNIARAHRERRADAGPGGEFSSKAEHRTITMRQVAMDRAEGRRLKRLFAKRRMERQLRTAT